MLQTILTSFTYTSNEFETNMTYVITKLHICTYIHKLTYL